MQPNNECEINKCSLIQSNSVCLSFCLSVYPSVTFRCSVQMNEDTTVGFLTSGRTIILVSGEVKFIWIFARDHPNEGVKVKQRLSL